MKLPRIGTSILVLACVFGQASAADNSAVALQEPAGEVWRGWLWIPLDQAFDSNGTLVSGRLPDHVGQSLSMTVYVDDSELRTAAALAVKRERDCPVITARSACRIEPRPNSTLAELTQSAGEILLGRIVTQHPGLLIGQPGTLLEVAVEQSLKGKPPDRVFLFYPRLRAILGAAVVCHQDAGFRLAPRTGDRVVFFSWEKPLNRSGTLFMPEPTEMIFADAAGDLRGPARRDQYPSELKTLDDLVVAIGHALGR